mgnify:CR=1 FL=1
MGVDIDSLPGPSAVPRVRTERYIGDDNGVYLSDMYEEDAAIVRRTYAFLKDTLSALETGISDADPLWVTDSLRRMRFLGQIKRFTSRLNTDGYDDRRRALLRQVFHDLRGGALTVAYSRVQLAEMKGSETEMSDVYGAFFAVRDHLKIMRNCVVDLDPERRQRDRKRRTHSAALMREKWEGYADGAVARARNQVTDLGKLMDPFADVISRLTYFLCFSLVGIMPAWVLIIIFYREFGIIFIRLLMYREGTALAARRGGKTKALLYFASAGFSLVLLTLERMQWLANWQGALHIVVTVVYVAAALMALLSFLDYMRVFRDRRTVGDAES